MPGRLGIDRDRAPVAATRPSVAAEAGGGEPCYHVVCSVPVQCLVGDRRALPARAARVGVTELALVRGAGGTLVGV